MASTGINFNMASVSMNVGTPRSSYARSKQLQLSFDIISLIAECIPNLYIPWRNEHADHGTFIEYGKAAMAFSQFSRTFREVALHTQALWSRIYVGVLPQGGSIIFPWELFVERSGKAPLFVVWAYTNSTLLEIDSVLQRLAALFRNQGRWREVHLHDDISFYIMFLVYNNSNDMPSLPALEIISAREALGHRDGIPFMAPNLKHMSTNLPSMFIPLASSLISCKTEILFKIFTSQQSTLDENKVFLTKCTNLEYLWIIIENISDDEVEHMDVVLPSLKSLRLDSLLVGCWRPVGAFLRSMHMDRLEALEMRYVWNMDDWITNFQNLGFANNIRSLTLMALFDELEGGSSVPLKRIGETFCNISSLTVSGWSSIDQFCECLFPALRIPTIEVPAYTGTIDCSGTFVGYARAIVEVVLIFLSNRKSDGDDESFRLILCSFGLVDDDNSVQRTVAKAGCRLVLETYSSAESFYSFASPYTFDKQYLV